MKTKRILSQEERDRYEGPVTLTRKQFNVLWEELEEAMDSRTEFRRSRLPGHSSDPSDEDEEELIEHEQAFCRMERIRLQLNYDVRQQAGAA